MAQRIQFDAAHFSRSALGQWRIVVFRAERAKHIGMATVGCCQQSIPSQRWPLGIERNQQDIGVRALRPDMLYGLLHIVDRSTDIPAQRKRLFGEHIRAVISDLGHRAEHRNQFR